MKRKLILTLIVLATTTMMAQYTIYPVPQKIKALEGTAQFSEKVCLIADENIDEITIQRAKQVLSEHGLTAEINSQTQRCTSVIYLKTDPNVAVVKKFDAHTLELNHQEDGMASLTITGQNTDAVFYGLASLEQMLDEKGTSSLPCVSIQDYADQKQRGIVEGYYGYPYSVEVKKDLMRFMMRMKMNTYLYGAKSDPYHSQNWKDPYPTSISEEEEKGGWLSQDMVRDVCQVSRDTKVNFIWAIHPGNNFVGSSTVITDIINKFKKMYELGVRQFAVFVDDVSIPSNEADMKTNADRLTELQHKIESTFNKEGVAPLDTVRPLHFVPQIYCRSFASSQQQFENFFRALSSTPNYITIYTTGWGVWSTPNVSDYNNTAQYLGREVAWWWNYPCNDNADAQIYPMDMYQNFVDMPAVGNNNTLPTSMQDRGYGIVSNPMQQGEIAKTPLFSVADYAWHNAGFKNKSSWEASFKHIIKDPNLAEAYRTLAPYLTQNDPSSGWITTTTSAAVALPKITTLLDNIEMLSSLKESSVESDRLLYADLRPWLLKLNKMLQIAKQFYMTQGLDNTDADGVLNESKWISYIEAINGLEDLDNNEDYIVATLEGMNYKNVGYHKVKPSQKVLATVLENLKTSSIRGFIPTKGTKPAFITNGSLTGSTTNSNGQAYITMATKTLQPSEYVGMTFPEARFATISVADTLVQNYAVLYSIDGKNWIRLEVGNQLEGKIKHIVIANDSSVPASLKLAKSILNITLQNDPTISNVTLPAGNEYGGHEAKYLIDGDYNTWFTMNANQKNGDAYTLILSEEAPIRMVRVAIGTTNGDYMNTGRIEISTDNKTWTKLTPVGKLKTTFTINDMTTLTDVCKVLDFDGKGQRARYIRLYNQIANTNKWLRIFEMQPFYDTVAPDAIDKNGRFLANVSDGLPFTFDEIDNNMTYYLRQVGEVEKITLLTGKGISYIEPSDKAATEVIYEVKDSAERIYEVLVSAKTTGTLPGLTHILQTINTNQQRGMFYDLSGRSFNVPKQSGLYIHNGRKLIKY